VLAEQELTPTPAPGSDDVVLDLLLYAFDVMVVLVVAALFWRMLA
jgi:hypothetical protein